jgi:hypothetical protein
MAYLKIWKTCARAAVLAGCPLLCANPVFAADVARNYLDVSAGFSQGEFGTGVNTDLYRLQVDYGQIIGRYNFSVSAPYLILRDRAGNESGVGDVNLQAGMTFNDDIFAKNSFFGSVSLKLPTADENKGLGTGESDIGGLLGYTGRFGTYSLTMTGGYIITGDTSTQSYNDVLIYSAGLSKYSQPWYVYGRLDGQQRVVDSGDNPLELSGGFFYRVKTTQYLRAEVFTGLNDSSPDLGLTLGVTNWF